MSASLARMSVCVWARYRSISPPHPMHEAREVRGEWEREKKITHSTLTSTSLRPNRISASARSLTCSSDLYRSLGSNLGTDRSRRQERQGVSFVGRPISYHATVFRPSQVRAMEQRKKDRDRNTRKDKGTQLSGSMILVSMNSDYITFSGF